MSYRDLMLQMNYGYGIHKRSLKKLHNFGLYLVYFKYMNIISTTFLLML